MNTGMGGADRLNVLTGGAMYPATATTSDPNKKIPPVYVKPYVKRGKSDAADAGWPPARRAHSGRHSIDKQSAQVSITPSSRSAQARQQDFRSIRFVRKRRGGEAKIVLGGSQSRTPDHDKASYPRSPRHIAGST